MKRYLVVGLAKTGTTAISKAVQAAQGIDNYSLEPKDPAFFATLAHHKQDCVAKILFDHWMDRHRLLNAIVFDDFRTGFIENIFIARDPRAELISRLHYVAWPRFTSQPRSEQEERDWVALFRRKETDPSFSLREMLETLKGVYGVNLTRSFARNTTYARYLGKLPARRHTLVRYEDFTAGTARSDLFGSPVDVGPDLQRTNRTGGADDWTCFLSQEDLGWLNEQLAEPLDRLGYDLDVDVGGQVDPANCSVYVEGLVAKARERHKEKQVAR